MRNVAPSRALVRRSRRLLELAFVVVAAGIFLAIFGLALYVVPLTTPVGPSFDLFNMGRSVLFIGGIFMGIAGLGMAVRAVTWKTENDLALLAGERLAEHLDERYTFIRNISKRNLGYIDAVLVGPAGVLVFRIIDQEGRYLNEGANWMRGDGRNWKPALINPTRDTVEDVKSLRAYLAEFGLSDVPIFGVIVFTKDDPILHLTLKDPVVPATHLSSLYVRLQNNYLARERIDKATAVAVVQLLYDQ